MQNLVTKMFFMTYGIGLSLLFRQLFSNCLVGNHCYGIEAGIHVLHSKIGVGVYRYSAESAAFFSTR